ncbi:MULTISPECIES: FTR1 family iron permease [unclassified Archaeoglobus]|jgi:high-affinity iron transporter|uniref:FTR1 family iron permease n=1 Tax=unclassified Archaeoglobus TaxID=2643606 RepID=UPI0025B8723E|nr:MULTISPECIES: FTR1 family protein [unclassified Archaeoglobus]
MLGQFVISLREGFEAVLLVAILVAYLRRTGRVGEIKFAYYGAIAALLSGAGIALAIVRVYGGLEGGQRELFEGFASYLAVGVLTYMILWMAGRDVRREIETRVGKRIARGVALIAYVFVIREVVEAVLFLTPFAIHDTFGTVIGSLAGVFVAFLLSFTILRMEYRLSMRMFFYLTSMLLVFISSGLAGYGTHELIEVAEEELGVETWLFEPAYDFGLDESSILHNENIVGGILAVMFGYAVKMEWLRVFVQLGYLAVTLPLVWKGYGYSR